MVKIRRTRGVIKVGQGVPVKTASGKPRIVFFHNVQSLSMVEGPDRVTRMKTGWKEITLRERLVGVDDLLYKQQIHYVPAQVVS